MLLLRLLCLSQWLLFPFDCLALHCGFCFGLVFEHVPPSGSIRCSRLIMYVSCPCPKSAPSQRTLFIGDWSYRPSHKDQECCCDWLGGCFQVPQLAEQGHMCGYTNLCIYANLWIFLYRTTCILNKAWFHIIIANSNSLPHGSLQPPLCIENYLFPIKLCLLLCERSIDYVCGSLFLGESIQSFNINFDVT